MTVTGARETLVTAEITQDSRPQDACDGLLCPGLGCGSVVPLKLPQVHYPIEHDGMILGWPGP